MIKNIFKLLLLQLIFVSISCQKSTNIGTSEAGHINPFTWSNATIYFLMTDRFYDGDKTNNYVHSPDNPPAPYRGYMGGDLKGITQKIEDGYFSDLGVNAIWMTPVVEQIQGSVDEGTGNSFGFHGYWTRDWTAIDSKFGTKEDLKELVNVAHSNNIRILIDVVANHTGPVTPLDSKWPDEWVKTGPRCTYTSAETTINCTLVDNLPDIRTESDEEVALPPFLIEKWKQEGRYQKEIDELDDWFKTTGYPRTAVNYILKWLVDFIREYGVDGFRVDTVKHTEDKIWSDLWKQARIAYEDYKANHSDVVLDQDAEFYMMGEVYNYYISGGRSYDYGDDKVDFFSSGFESLINFDFKSDAHKEYEEIFRKYDDALHGPLAGKSVINYISSHDDGHPMDLHRELPIESATKLLLCPGGVQIYYGDESARTLTVEADGDAKLRSFMNWDEVSTGSQINGFSRTDILSHWQKLGKFRRDNIAVGAGRHLKISDVPYIFQRTYSKDDVQNKVVVGLDLSLGKKEIAVGANFKEGAKILDAYSGQSARVTNQKVQLDTPYEIVLLQVVD